MGWIFLVLIYGLFKGGREIAKKKAMTRNTVMEVLVAYTVLSLIMVVPQAKDAGGLELKYYFLIAFKSFCMFIAWICSFNSLKKLPVSLFGILSLSRVLFATLLGVLVLHETMGALQITGLVLVCSGLLMLKFKPNANKTDRVVPLVAEEINPSVKENITIYVIIAFISCLMNSISGFMDKILMKDITSSQLQFWYMLFIVFYYAVYILIKKEKISLSVIKNPWVWILAVLFVTGDKALFIANADPDSKISVMTLIKQSACIVTILGGKFIFKEKGIAWKLLCASVIISGIVLGVLK
ncbi:MAG: EamA family transporter [Treponema sp.]|nr:EamA family transporter [Treponema sp.]